MTKHPDANYFFPASTMMDTPFHADLPEAGGGVAFISITPMS